MLGERHGFWSYRTILRSLPRRWTRQWRHSMCGAGWRNEQTKRILWAQTSMLENRRDEEATKRAYQAADLRDGKKRSYISLAGHWYRRGIDRSDIRARVFRAAEGKCCFCGGYVAEDSGDMDHMRGGRKHLRCDCFDTPLPDGRRCTNVRWSHSMADRANACHRQRHHREVMWTKRREC